MRRKTSAFIGCAKDSAILAIEIFNRPSDAGRQEAVLLLFEHAFEMILKAAILEKTGRIRGPREKYNYGFEKCLGIAQSQLGVLDKDEALILRNLNGFRDAAAHDLVDISEGLLYGHAQSAIQIFASLLKKVFRRELSAELPRRILPISTMLPGDITVIVAEDMASISAMLAKGRRREDDAEAKLRPYQIMEKNIREVQGVAEQAPTASRILRGLKGGEWKTILPMVAGLVQSSPGGIPISLHLTKHNGFPVRIDAVSPTAIAFRYIKPEDKYPYLTSELAEKLGITTTKAAVFAKILRLKNDDEYHTSIKISRSGRVQRYSEKAYNILANAIQRLGVDCLWQKWKTGETLEPNQFAGVDNNRRT
jgi:hypothetical protein